MPPEHDQQRRAKHSYAIHVREVMNKAGISGAQFCAMAKIEQGDLDNILYQGAINPSAKERVDRQLSILMGMQP